jgi:hypothetical protein
MTHLPARLPAPLPSPLPAALPALAACLACTAFATAATLCAALAAGEVKAVPSTARQMPIDLVAPLLADDGSAYPSAHAMPAAEAAVAGPAPGWATQAQRDQLQRLHPSRVVRLRATGQTLQVQRMPSPQAWVFVEGEQQAAVRLARRVAAAGVERVWVVTRERKAAPAQTALADRAVRRSQP